MAAPSHRISRLLVAGLLCVSSVASGQAPAGNAAELDVSAAFERARIYYESGRYVPCVALLPRGGGGRPGLVEGRPELGQLTV